MNLRIPQIPAKSEIWSLQSVRSLPQGLPPLGHAWYSSTGCSSGNLFKLPQPPQPASFNLKEQWLYYEALLTCLVLHSLMKSKPRNPAEDPHFHCLCSGPYSFCHPKLMSTCKIVISGRHVIRFIRWCKLGDLNLPCKLHVLIWVSGLCLDGDYLHKNVTAPKTNCSFIFLTT